MAAPKAAPVIAVVAMVLLAACFFPLAGCPCLVAKSTGRVEIREKLERGSLCSYNSLVSFGCFLFHLLACPPGLRHCKHSMFGDLEGVLKKAGVERLMWCLVRFGDPNATF